MTWLLAVSVGPVQEFIAAARRTRDLWLGSHLLSEISRAVAGSIQKEEGARPIFPATLETDNVANVILAELDEGEPSEVARRASEAAQRRWIEFAADARREAQGAIDVPIWNEQVNDVLEYYSAWVTRSGDYRTERTLVMRLLAGRKNCRDFLPAKGHEKVPKSSLDGQRESVLKPRLWWPRHLRRGLRVRAGEQLDVVGVVKRCAEGKKPYPSVSRIAADPWVRGNAAGLDNLKNECEELVKKGIIRPLDGKSFEKFSAFPYEGTAIYTSRHHEWEEEAELKSVELGMIDVEPLRAALAALPEPEPYLAVLVADGDRMGATISNLDSPEKNRAFSEKLAGFAGEARKIVTDHNGFMVYAGGDDVLAFVPVDLSLDCARRLHDKFAAVMSGYPGASLSVGVAIAHFLENLEDLLDYGRAAEKKAKEPDRDGLAVHLHKRGGSPVFIRAKWTEAPSPDRRIRDYAELILSGALPGGLPYELRRLEWLYEGWPPETAATALDKDVLRVIRAKQPKSGRESMKEIEGIVNDRVRDVTSLLAFAEELIVARQIAIALRQARASTTKAEVVRT